MSAIKVENKNAKGMWVDGYAINRMTVTETNPKKPDYGIVKTAVDTFEVINPVVGLSTVWNTSDYGVNYNENYIKFEQGAVGGTWTWTTKTEYSCRAYSGTIEFNTSYEPIASGELIKFELGINHNIKIQCYNMTAENSDNWKITAVINGIRQNNVNIIGGSTGASNQINFDMHYDRSKKQYVISLIYNNNTTTFYAPIREGFGKLFIKLNRAGETTGNPSYDQFYRFYNEQTKYTIGIDGNDFNPVPFDIDITRKIAPQDFVLAERKRKYRENFIKREQFLQKYKYDGWEQYKLDGKINGILDKRITGRKRRR